MSEARRSRLEGELQRVLSELISRGVKDPRVGNVTITAVTLAPDLSTARVYFVPFAGRHAPDEVREGLTHAGGFLRGEAGRALRLRHAPRLEFLFDEQPDRAQQLTDLIDRAVKSDRASSPDPADDTPR
jgi:ribosome-binding factor A